MPATPKLSITRSISQGDLNPVGMIVQSMLTEAQFQALNGTSWVLADGRSVSGSSYQTVTGTSNIPDLRGMVLRGKNNSRSDGSQDPGGERSLGNFQNHAFYSHSHDKGTYSIPSGGSHRHLFKYQFGPGAQNAITLSSGVVRQQATGDEIDTEVHSHPNSEFSGNSGSTGDANETRMRNIAVNHFIKIN